MNTNDTNRKYVNVMRLRITSFARAAFVAPLRVFEARCRKNTRHAGFTLVETLVAISVLLLAVAGPLTVATQSLTSAAFARDQIIAFYLAQEATELLRNKRDNNVLALKDWNSGFGECMGQGCVVDATLDIDSGDAIQTCEAGGCPTLRRDLATGLYGYSEAWPESKYTRTVVMKGVETNVEDDELKISVTISWQTGSLQKSFTIQENIMHWQ